MGMMASQITSLMIVYSTVYSSADQSKHQSSASLAFVQGIHWRPVNSSHKWPVTQKMFPFDDIIMESNFTASIPATKSYLVPFCMSSKTILLSHLTGANVFISLALSVGNPLVTNGFPLKRASSVELWCFPCCQPEKKLLEKQLIFQWFQVPWRLCDRIVTNTESSSDISVTNIEKSCSFPRICYGSMVSLGTNLWHQFH